MRLFLCLIALLLVGGSVAGEISLSGQDRDLGKITKSGARPLRIAIVQMRSLGHDIDGNLRQATTYAEEAAARGAQFVLYPEFMPTGSYLSSDTWDFAEPSSGKTVQWLKSTSKRLEVWLGAGFFEADGADFYDTFVVTAPAVSATYPDAPSVLEAPKISRPYRVALADKWIWSNIAIRHSSGYSINQALACRRGLRGGHYRPARKSRMKVPDKITPAYAPK